MDFFSQYFEEKKIIVFWFDLLRKIEEIILSNDNLKVFFLSAKLSVLLCWCQIVLVPNCLVPNCPFLLCWCQIVRVPNCPVPNCPVPNCPTTIFSSVPLNNEYHAAKSSCYGRNHLLWRVTCELWMSSLCLWSQSTGKILKVSGKPTMLPRSPSWMRICILMHSETLGIYFQRTGFERKKYNSIWIKLHYGEVEKRRAESCHLFTVFSLQ